MISFIVNAVTMVTWLSRQQSYVYQSYSMHLKYKRNYWNMLKCCTRDLNWNLNWLETWIHSIWLEVCIHSDVMNAISWVWRWCLHFYTVLSTCSNQSTNQPTIQSINQLIGRWAISVALLLHLWCPLDIFMP